MTIVDFANGYQIAILHTQELLDTVLWAHSALWGQGLERQI